MMKWVAFRIVNQFRRNCSAVQTSTVACLSSEPVFDDLLPTLS